MRRRVQQFQKGQGIEALIGAAGVHLVCSDLLLKGHQVSMAAEGLRYDVVVDRGGQLYKVQVKTTSVSPSDVGRARSIYRFGLKRAKGNSAIYEDGDCDWFAFAFLDIRKVAYLSFEQMRSPRTGNIKQALEWRSREHGHIPRDRWGNVISFRTMAFVEDFAELPE